MRLLIPTLAVTCFTVVAQPGSPRAIQVRTERQPCADLGNGHYRNPVLAGNYGDPSVVKVGRDYYMAFSRGDGMMIWHSRDLVNWEPVIRHSFRDLSGIWAVDLQHFDGRFHLFMPVGEWPGKRDEKYRANFVVHAEKPEGPWSEPIRVDREFIADDYYTGIDPGFVEGADGGRYLYTDHGYVMPLDSSGHIATGLPRIVYRGWSYPRDWVVEGECLESPKLLNRGGWYYLVSAMGGTSGPSTAHMAVVARSKGPTGPWENSPFNPLVRTWSADEPWWQQGHATLVEGPDGNWWAIYHARLNGVTGLGRQTLLLPVEWTPDEWPIIRNGHRSWETIPMPKGENVGHGMPISDEFESREPGIQWIVSDSSRALMRWGGGRLELKGAGGDGSRPTAASVMAVNASYEAVVEVECPEGVIAGLVFGNDEGLKTDGRVVQYNRGEIWRTRRTDVSLNQPGRVWLKVRNLKQDLSFACSEDGENWVLFQNGVRGGQYTVRLFASGRGTAVFRHFRYFGLD